MKTGFIRLPLKRALSMIFLVLAWLFLAFLLGQPTPSQESEGWDFMAFWLGPRLLLQGESPYDAAAWSAGHARSGFPPQDGAFLYPLPTAVLLLPVGFFSLHTAALIWAAVSLAAIFFVVRSVLRSHLPIKPTYFLPVLAGTFFLRPVAVLLFLLQIDWIILSCVTAAWFFFRCERWFLGGLWAGLTIIKPQVGVPLLVFFGVWQVFHARWKAVVGEAVSLAGLLVLGLAFDPGWIERWLAIGSAKTAFNFYSTPTLWGLSALVCRPSLACVQGLGAALTILLAAALLWITLRKNKDDLTYIMCTVICGVLFITPFLWVYSQTLLVLPLLMVTIALFRLDFPYLVVAGFPLLAALASFGLVGISIWIGADMVSALLPILVWVPLALVYRKDPKLLRVEGVI
jgi:hypothetical protein